MSPRSRVVVVGFLALLAIVAGSVVVGAQPGGVSDQSPADVSSVESLNLSTTLWIELGEAGDAHWNVSMVATLPDQAAVDSFSDLAAAFEENETEILSPATFRRYAEVVDRSTGRDMQLSGVDRETTVADNTGRLELSFTWENFGRGDGSTVHVADAFTGPDGLWLRGLRADQQLVVTVPESFDITSAPKGYTNRTIRWQGPTDFEPADFEITYDVNPSPTITPTPTPTPTVTSTPTPTPTISTSSTESTRTTGAGPNEGGGIPPLAIVAAVIVAGAVGAYLFRNGGDLPITNPAADDDGATAESSGDDPADSGAITTAESSDDEPETDATDEGQPPLDRELLSDEEYVERLLERNGGRMKQANIVTETEWSNAKVSQLLSAMAEDGRIEKLRIGRENLISFPDDESEVED